MLCGVTSRPRDASPRREGGSPPRDTGRSLVYAVEDQVARALDRAAAGAPTTQFYGSALTMPTERRFADLASVRRWVHAVLALPVVTARWPGTPACDVRARRGSRAAHYEAPGTIAVPVDGRWAMRELVLCHELAHHLVLHEHSGHRHPGHEHTPGHGPAFREAYAELVTMVIGPEVALLLRAGFDQALARDAP